MLVLDNKTLLSLNENRSAICYKGLPIVDGSLVYVTGIPGYCSIGKNLHALYRIMHGGVWLNFGQGIFFPLEYLLGEGIAFFCLSPVPFVPNVFAPAEKAEMLLAA